MCAQPKKPDSPWQILADDGREVDVLCGGTEYRFVRLTWRERSLIVHDAVTVDEAGIELEPTRFAQRLLDASLQFVGRADGRQPIMPEWLDDCPVELGDRLTEIALHINGRKPVTGMEKPRADGTLDVELGQHVYRLVPWTWGQRNRALRQAVIIGEDTRPLVDAVGFYRAVLLAMCVAIDNAPPPSGWLDTLPADLGDTLLDTALPMSGQDRDSQARIAQALRARLPDDGIALYTLCKEFGWTPNQVRIQRAVDIDTLLAVHRMRSQASPEGGIPRPVHDSIQSAQPRTTARSDETVILITDE